jgi:hypothetical protein
MQEHIVSLILSQFRDGAESARPSHVANFFGTSYDRPIMRHDKEVVDKDRALTPSGRKLQTTPSLPVSLADHRVSS